jgi:hypothetical protein
MPASQDKERKGREGELMGEKSKKFKAFLDRLEAYRVLPHKFVGFIEDVDNWHCEVYSEPNPDYENCYNCIGTAGNESSIKQIVFNNGSKITFHSEREYGRSPALKSLGLVRRLFALKKLKV